MRKIFKNIPLLNILYHFFPLNFKKNVFKNPSHIVLIGPHFSKTLVLDLTNNSTGY